MADYSLPRNRIGRNQFSDSPKSAEDWLGGKTKGWLTILHETRLPPKAGAGARGVVCLCICGKIVTRYLHRVKMSGHPSCGCYIAPRNGTNSWKHGGASNGKVDPEYRSWHGAKTRCYKKDDTHYPGYGGRGIIMCDRWLNSYPNFLQDMGRRPEKSWTLDRIDVNGNHEPSNCRWASKQTQAQNRRNTVWITVGRETMTASEFTERSMLSPFLVNKMAKDGMSGDDIARESIAALESLLKM